MATAAAVWPAPARALELPKLLKKPLTLDVTEVSILSQRVQTAGGLGLTVAPQDLDVDGGGPWGQWLNRLNASLIWNKITVGLRLDSVVYWNTPASMDQFADSSRVQSDDLTRFQNAIYPAKMWVTYNAPGVELTVGDAYVQLARGLVITARKVDDLGLDTTVRGAKVAITKGPFAFTLVGGYMNPSRIDEPSGRSLFLSKTVPSTNPAYESNLPFPVFGSDHVIAGEIKGGQGGPVVFGTSASNFTRCAPYQYYAGTSRIYDEGPLLREIGYCDAGYEATWLDSIADNTSRTRQSQSTTTVAQSMEVPKLGPLGNLYVVGAIQNRSALDPSMDDQGNAIYAAYSGSVGPVTNTVELKSNRNFYSVDASLNATKASAFSNVFYATTPTTEVITQDNQYGFFNACVDGGRIRSDVRVSKDMLVYLQGIYAYTKTEQNARCTRDGSIIVPAGQDPREYENQVFDGLSGIQYDFDDNTSYLYATIGARNDVKATGEPFYRQSEITYTFSKHIKGPISVELTGRHRVRWEDNQNFQGTSAPQYWVEGENYTALKIAPKWVITQGIEYTTKNLPPTYGYPPWLYINAGVLYRFTADSNLKVLVGQQRPGLKCVSGVCRFFPAYEGARAELTVRF